MKVIATILLFVACVAAGTPQENLKITPQCDVAFSEYDRTYGKMNSGICGSIKDKNNIPKLCANPKCRNIKIPDQIRSACNSDPNDQLLMESLDLFVTGLNTRVDKLCNNQGASINNKPSGSQGSSSGLGSGSTNTVGNTAGNNAAPNNVATNNVTGNNAAGNNAAGNGAATNNVAANNVAGNNVAANNTAGNFTNVIAGNSTNPAVTNETNLSAGSKLSYSLVTAFALAAFHLLL